ncbi:hypothetical protein P3T23_005382 [Paraburkholderia sp. GAS448]|uniref:hypothetical protein n=1 Tax=Paraburkholderia sp. GAS448 TaxID=3035136 RepID=UPI003D1DE0E9
MNEGGEPFRAWSPPVMGSRRAVLRQKPPDKEAILPTGRMRETNDLSQLAIELAGKNFTRRPKFLSSKVHGT